ncbi:MAG: hypothetical protein JW908_04355 [Anaerolineales bacterium]|nr:hypothetical protein [Anaerolineales bacterium]
MNILIEELPNDVEIDGIEYEINSDFRSCLRIILAFEDNDLAAIEKQMVLIDNLYKNKPNNLDQAIRQGIKFLNGGRNELEAGTDMRLYSFEKDAPFIMAAFKQTHGIDLDTANMHWWKFMTLFMDMGSETTFSNLVSLRKRVKTGKASKEERAAAREIADIFELPEIDNRTLEEREVDNEFVERFKRGKESRGK